MSNHFLMGLLISYVGQPESFGYRLFVARKSIWCIRKFHHFWRNIDATPQIKWNIYSGTWKCHLKVLLKFRGFCDLRSFLLLFIWHQLTLFVEITPKIGRSRFTWNFIKEVKSEWRNRDVNIARFLHHFPVWMLFYFHDREHKKFASRKSCL